MTVPDQVAGFELSAQQEQLWMRDPTGCARSSVLVRVPGPAPSRADLARAVDGTIARHEVLRTRLVLPSGLRVPLQVIDDTGAATVEVLDETGDLAERAAAGAGLVVLAAPDEEGHQLALGAPATQADVTSLLLLAGELRGHEVQDDPLQYADYAAWQQDQRRAVDDATTEGRLHWQAFPSGGATMAAEPGTRAAHDSATTAALESLAASLGATAVDVLLALTAAVAARHTGETSVLLGLATDGRGSDEVTGAVGPYTRTLPLTVQAEGPLRETVARAAAARATALRFAEQTPPAVAVPGWTVRDAVPVGVLAAVEGARPSGVEVSLSDVVVTGVHGATAEHLRDAVAVAVAAATAGGPVEDLPVVGRAEQHLLVDVLGRGADAASRSGSVDEWIAEQASRTPGRTAVTAGAVSLTYTELEARVNQLACRLRGLGAGPGTVVALAQDRTADLVVSLLAVLRAGAAYLPLNPEHPTPRLALYLDHAQPVVTLASSTTAASLPAGTVSLLVDVERSRLDALPSDRPATVAGPEDPAYLIYTSGSTGAPKGVVIPRRALAHYTASVMELVGLTDEPLVFGMVTGVSTDLGNTVLFTSLVSGGTLDVVPRDVATDPDAFAAHVSARRHDVLKATPSHLEALLSGGPATTVLPRRLLVLGGEALPWRLAELLSGAGRLVNHYGPTEVTVGALLFEVSGAEALHRAAATVPIGRPFPGARVLVVDAQLRPVPLGAPGELLLGGPGLATGYLGAPEHTSTTFLDDVAGTGARFYRTGDLVRMLTDGSVVFLGRADGQVKVRGYRVELGEIEAALREDAAVRQATVVLRPDGRLAAYVVLGQDDATADQRLRSWLRADLPEHMVPSTVTILPALPRLANGKVDKFVLPTPVVAAATGGEPRTAVERELAAIWSEVLELPSVGVDDDFFALGGHSLLAAQVAARVRSTLGVPVALHALFTAPTVAALAEVVVGEMAGGADLESVLAELDGMSDGEAEQLLGSLDG